MSRIIAGRFGGRRLATPSGSGTRPTSERVRESVFARLEHLGALTDAHVLDLYAGSGALALEALSRGALGAVLVEKDRRSAAVATRNVRDLGLGDVVSVRTAAAERVVAEPLHPSIDLLLVDPPYAVDEDALAGVLAGLVAQGSLAPDAIVMVERSSRSPEPGWPDGMELIDPRTYGDTTCWFAQYTPPAGTAEHPQRHTVRP